MENGDNFLKVYVDVVTKISDQRFMDVLKLQNEAAVIVSGIYNGNRNGLVDIR